MALVSIVIPAHEESLSQAWAGSDCMQVSRRPGPRESLCMLKRPAVGCIVSPCVAGRTGQQGWVIA